MLKTQSGFAYITAILLIASLAGFGSYLYTHYTPKEVELPSTNMADPEGYVIYESNAHFLATTNLTTDTFTPLNKDLDQINPDATFRNVFHGMVKNPAQTKVIAETGSQSPAQIGKHSNSDIIFATTDGKVSRRLHVDEQIKKTFGASASGIPKSWGPDDNSFVLSINILGDPVQHGHALYNLTTDTVSELIDKELNERKTLSLYDYRDKSVTLWSPSEKYFAKIKENNDLIEVFDKDKKLITSARLGTFTDPKNDTIQRPQLVLPYKDIIFSSDETSILINLEYAAYTDHSQIQWKTLDFKTGELKLVKIIPQELRDEVRRPLIWKKP